MPVYLSPTVGTVDQRLRPGSPFRRRFRCLRVGDGVPAPGDPATGWEPLGPSEVEALWGSYGPFRTPFGTERDMQ